MSAFTASDLSVSLADKLILRAISFDVEEGRWIGLLGPNGAGKTTLLRTLSGLIPYDGSVLLDGTEIRSWHVRDLARRLALVRQTHSLSFDFRVDELVLLGRSPHKSLLSMYEKADYDLVDRALKLVDLEAFEDRSVTSLSGGEQQRVFLAQALVQEASILLLDEPTTHLDVHHQFDFLHHVKDYVYGGKTVIGAFHDLELAARFSDVLLVLNNGIIVAHGLPEEVLTSEMIADVFHMDAVVEVSDSGRPIIRYIEPLTVNR